MANRMPLDQAVADEVLDLPQVALVTDRVQGARVAAQGASDTTVVNAAIANHVNPDVPEFEDFGKASFVGNNGTSHYFRVD